MTGLPSDLKEGIERAVEGLSRNEIARRAAALSERYRSGGTSKSLDAPLDIAAYLLARLPATYAATICVLSEAAARTRSFAPTQVLDLGAGPGTASWAAIEIWPALETVRLCDSNPHLLEMAKRLAALSSHGGLSRPQTVLRDFTAVPLASSDLVIAAYALGEIAPAQLQRTVASLWDACEGLLVLIEPGTPQGFERIRAARAALIEKGARIAAPCPHRQACPVVAPDWCHFSRRLPRSRDHMLAKSADVPFEDEKFSYVAMARENVRIESFAARVLAPPHRNKAAITLKLCEEGQIREAVIPARERKTFAHYRRVAWGDALESTEGSIGAPH